MKHNKPTIRFKGFEEEWEKNSLEELSSKIGDGLHGTPQYVVNGGVYFINGNNLDSGVIKISKETKQVSVNQMSVNDKLLGLNTLLISINGTIGNIAEYYGEKVMLGKSVAYINLEKLNRKFTFSLLQSPSIQNSIFENLTGSTIKNLGLKAIRETEILYPKSELEQQQIGTFFQNLDTLITQHQQKHSKLQALKKAMLAKMFPKQGQTTPEIRFIGFSGEWKKAELGSIAKITMGQSPNGINYTNNPNDSILVQGNADLKNGEVVPRIWTKEITKTAEKGDIIFTVRAPVGEVGQTSFNVVIGRGVASIKGNEFVYQTLKKMNEDGFWKKLSAGSTFDSINSTELYKAEIFTTTELEQQQIGNYFKNLDSLITHHQTQIEKLQHLKKAFLGKMFV